MYKALVTFEIPGLPEFEAGQQYAEVPNAKDLKERGLIEKVVEKVSHETKSNKK